MAVTEKAVPLGAITIPLWGWVWMAGPWALTVMPVWLPVMELEPVSVALRDWEPAVYRVAVKACVPLSAPTNV